MSLLVCCVPGCTVVHTHGVPLHYFPNPKKELERFQKWVNIIGGDVVSMDATSVYKKKRICHRHFQKVFFYPKSKLCKLAVPSLNLSSGSMSEDRGGEETLDDTTDEFISFKVGDNKRVYGTKKDNSSKKDDTNLTITTMECEEPESLKQNIQQSDEAHYQSNDNSPKQTDNRENAINSDTIAINDINQIKSKQVCESTVGKFNNCVIKENLIDDRPHDTADKQCERVTHQTTNQCLDDNQPHDQTFKSWLDDKNLCLKLDHKNITRVYKPKKHEIKVTRVYKPKKRKINRDLLFS